MSSVQETYLKAIADAIREKAGSSDPIPANEFAARILALKSGNAWTDSQYFNDNKNNGSTLIAYGNGVFVIFEKGTKDSDWLSSAAAYSTDGINWTQVTLPVTTNWQNLVYGGGKFVAFGGDAGNNDPKCCIYSTDGIIWHIVSSLPDPGYFNSVPLAWGSLCYGKGRFVAIAWGYNAAQSVLCSTDGINWNKYTLPKKANWGYVCYGNEKFVTASSASNDIAYSTDGINWTLATIPSAASNANWNSLIFGNGVFVAYNFQRVHCILYSTDGINWNFIDMSAEGESFYNLLYAYGTLIIGPSNNGTSESDVALKSANGIEWTHFKMPFAARWYEIVTGNGVSVALVRLSGSKYRLYYRTDLP